MGLKILSPDINRSEIKYTGKDRAVRVGLMQLKDLSQESKDTVIDERSKNGLFVSLEDFLDRTGSHIHLQDVRILIKAGCFDSIAQGTTRAGLMWHALRFFDQKEEEKTPGLFDGAQPPVALNHRTKPPQGAYAKDLILKHEMETLGLFLSIHPLARYKDILESLNYVRARNLNSWVGKQVTTIGWQITGKTVHTKDGETMKFISFEDQTDIYETVFFPKPYNRYCHMLNAARPYILKGKVEETFGAITMTVNWIGFLQNYRGKKPTPMAPRLHNTAGQALRFSPSIAPTTSRG